MYGPGKLSLEEEAQYWAECAVAAELQTCDPADIPRSREELRAYYERLRPQLSGSEPARKAMHHLLDATVMLPPVPRVLKPATWVIGRVLRAATIATMPRWMRELGGLRQSRVVDRPRDAHLELRARQAQRVFGEHVAPSDEGLIESEPVLGRMA